MNAKIRTRRLLCLLLAMMLVFSLLPATALAAGEAATLTSLTIRTGTNTADNSNALLTGTNSDGIPAFDGAVASYTLPCGTLTDTSTQLRFWYETQEAGTAVTLRWTDAAGADQSKALSAATDGTTLSNKWANCLHAGRNTFTLTVTPPAESEKIAGTYTFTLDLKPTLTALSLSTGGSGVYLKETFASGTTTYTADIAADAATLDVSATAYNDGAVLSYNGASADTVDISGTSTVTVGLALGEVTNSYTVTLNKIPAFDTMVTATPADATVIFYDTNGATIARGTGSATASGIIGGTYVVTAKGYIAQTGSLASGTTNLTLSAATSPTTALPDYTGDWTSFRGNEQNMGVTGAQTPITAAQTELKWAVKLGTGYAAAPTPPIIINGELYIYSNKRVFRLDKADGDILAQSADLAGTANFALNPIVYGGGLLFVQIGNGRVQALRADTLESVWISEQLGGQTLCPITYHNGYVYTGTWNAESETGTYFCLSVTDEDPAAVDETKLCTWKIDHMGGFYWAGAFATDSYVVFGSDDGTAEGDPSANGILYSVNPATGTIIDTIEGISGDIRSTVSYDTATGCVYCTTKGGLLIKVKMNANGSFDDTTYQTANLGGMSTGTPLVYDGNLFIGVCGPSQFSGTGHYFKVYNAADLAPITQVETLGYVQTSSLLTTGYQASDGKVYIYYTYNSNPGGIYAMEYDLSAKTGTSYELFVPDKSMQNYCICSLVCDSDGTIYYKNDSCYLMAVGKNSAWATDITCEAGEEPAATIEGFASGTLEYEIVVPRGTESVTVAATGSEGSSVLVANSLNSAEIDVSGGSAEVSVKVLNGSDYLRNYTLNIRWASNDTTVNVLLNTSNACGGTMATLDGNTYKLINATSITNIWLGEKNNNTIDTTSFEIISGAESTPAFTSKTSGNTNGGNTYLGYFRSSAFTFPLTAKFTVTAEDGATTATYYLVVTKDGEYTPASDKVDVTIADKGAVVVPQKEVTVTDRNYDGKFDVDEVLYAAHEAFYASGAAAGYASSVSQYGLGLTKLWGDTSGHFGYFINNGMATGLENEIRAGEHLYAYVTANAYPSADAYSYFDSGAYTATAGSAKAVSLTYQNGYDASWAPTFAAYPGATITAYDADFNALTSGFSFTDKGEGRYDVSFDSAGTYYIVATAAGNAIVPAVAKVTVSSAPSGPAASTDITVTFRLIGAERATSDVDLSKSAYLPAYVTWIKTDTYTLSKNATVGDLFKQALDGAGLGYVGFNKNYIETINAPEALGGYALSEFTNGTYSGWMYTLNGAHPGYGLNEQKLSDGDVVIWHYINDYRHEVEDWFDDEEYPALGDGTYWAGWLKAGDTFGGKSSGNTPSGPSNPSGSSNPAAVIEPEVIVSGESVTANVTVSQIADAILAVGAADGDITIISDTNAANMTVSIPKSAAQSVANKTSAALNIETAGGTVRIPNEALASITEQAAGSSINVTVEQKTVADVTDPDIDTTDAIVIAVTVKSGDKSVTEFGGKALEISVPVTGDKHIEGETYKVIVISADGKTDIITGKCVKVSGKLAVVVSTTHLSTFVVTAQKAGLPFTDVANHWSLDAIGYAYDHDLMNGVSGDRFDPDGTVNRAMLVTILYRLEGEPAVTTTNPFTDVPAKEWYTDAVIWAAENKIVDGYGNGLFGPTDKITREQMAKMLFAYTQFKKYDVSKANDLASFTDAGDVSSWALDAIKWANAEGLVTGRTTTTIVPGGDAIRAEAATILMRYMTNVVK